MNYVVNLSLTGELDQERAEELIVNLLETVQDHGHLLSGETLELVSVTEAATATPARAAQTATDLMFADDEPGSVSEAEYAAALESNLQALTAEQCAGVTYFISEEEIVYSAQGNVVGAISTRGEEFVVSLMDDELNELPGKRCAGTGADPLAVLHALEVTR